MIGLETPCMVLDTRFELVTTSMSWRHSTAELIEQIVITRLVAFIGRKYNQEILKSLSLVFTDPSTLLTKLI